MPKLQHDRHPGYFDSWSDHERRARRFIVKRKRENIHLIRKATYKGLWSRLSFLKGYKRTSTPSELWDIINELPY